MLVKFFALTFLLLFQFPLYAVSTTTADEAYSAFRQIKLASPGSEGELLALLQEYPILLEEHVVSQAYRTLLYRHIDHPTGFETYHTFVNNIGELDAIAPALAMRYRLVEAYNDVVANDYTRALERVEQVIAFAGKLVLPELRNDAMVTKAIIQARLGLDKQSLQVLTDVLGTATLMKNTRYFGDGALENVELNMGLLFSYSREADKAIALCESAERFFEHQPFGTSLRYYQIALDCQRRAYQTKGDLTTVAGILKRYRQVSLRANDMDSYLYSLELEMQYLIEQGDFAGASELFEANSNHIDAVLDTYDGVSAQISYAEALVRQEKVNNAMAVVKRIKSTLSNHKEWNVLASRAYSLEADLLAFQGQFETAFSLLKEAKDLSFESPSQTIGVGIVNDYYEDELAKRRVELLESENKLAKAELSQQQQLTLSLLVMMAVLTACVIGFIWLFIVLKRQKKQLVRQATTDSLTGIFNRAKSLQLSERALDTARRYQQPFTLALIDLDNFKNINDSFGHDAGDAVLKTFARWVSLHTRKTDIFGRYGGEEFLLCMPMTSEQEAKQVLTKILTEYRNTQVPGYPEIENLSFSAGLVSMATSSSINGLIKIADEQLYAAKHAGKARVI